MQKSFKPNSLWRHDTAAEVSGWLIKDKCILSAHFPLQRYLCSLPFRMILHIDRYRFLSLSTSNKEAES